MSKTPFSTVDTQVIATLNKNGSHLNFLTIIVGHIWKSKYVKKIYLGTHLETSVAIGSLPGIWWVTVPLTGIGLSLSISPSNLSNLYMLQLVDSHRLELGPHFTEEL